MCSSQDESHLSILSILASLLLVPCLHQLTMIAMIAMIVRTEERAVPVTISPSQGHSAVCKNIIKDLHCTLHASIVSHPFNTVDNVVEVLT